MACCKKAAKLRKLQNERAKQDALRRRRRKLAIIQHKKENKKRTKK